MTDTPKPHPKYPQPLSVYVMWADKPIEGHLYWVTPMREWLFVRLDNGDSMRLSNWEHPDELPPSVATTPAGAVQYRLAKLREELPEIQESKALADIVTRREQFRKEIEHCEALLRNLEG